MWPRPAALRHQRNLYYKWYRRYEAEGVADRRDRSRRPSNSPRATEPRGRGQDPLPAPELPLRAPEDRHVPGPLSRHRDLDVRRLADPQTRGHEPPAGLTTSQAPREALERYEKPLPGHQVQIDVKFSSPSRARARSSTTSSPPSTTAPGCGSSRSTSDATRRAQSPLPTTSSRSCPSRSRPFRPTMVPNSSPASTGTCSIAASATFTSTPHPAAQRQSRGPTGSTTRSSTATLEGVVIDDGRTLQR